MVASPADLVARLNGDRDARLKAVRDIKNVIIGNKQKKQVFVSLGAVPRVVELLSCDAGGPLLVQCAAAVGSFAYGLDAGVQAVLASGGVAHLLAALGSEDEAVVLAASRALKMVYQSPMAPAANALAGSALARLVRLLGAANLCVAEVAARVLARCCDTPEQQAAVLGAGGLGGLLALLAAAEPERREAAADALATLLSGSPAAAFEAAAAPGALGRLLAALRECSPAMRLLAARCLVALARALPEDAAPHSPEAVRRAVLPVLVKLLGCTPVREGVPGALAALLEDCPALHRAAADADAIGRLAAFLQDERCPARLKVGTLSALGTLCLDYEDHRRQLAEARVLPQIVRALDDPDPQVRAAACRCVRSMSRSVVALHCSRVGADVASPLFRRLQDPDPDIQATASATLCNVVLDTSPAQEAVLAAGGLATLVRLASSPAVELRINAAWALQNLMHHAGADVRAAVLAALPWERVEALAADADARVQERAVKLLQNVFAYCTPRDVEAAHAWSGGVALRLLVASADPAHAGAPLRRSHALYGLCNVAVSGEEAGRVAVMGSGAVPHIVASLADPDNAVRLAAVWCIIALSEPHGQPAAEARCGALQAAGAVGALRGLAEDPPSLDIRERARTALHNFGFPPPLPHLPGARARGGGSAPDSAGPGAVGGGLPAALSGWILAEGPGDGGGGGEDAGAGEAGVLLGSGQEVLMSENEDAVLSSL